jgi:hypothetical protein
MIFWLYRVLPVHRCPLVSPFKGADLGRNRIALGDLNPPLIQLMSCVLPSWISGQGCLLIHCCDDTHSSVTSFPHGYY